MRGKLWMNIVKSTERRLGANRLEESPLFMLGIISKMGKTGSFGKLCEQEVSIPKVVELESLR